MATPGDAKAVSALKPSRFSRCAAAVHRSTGKIKAPRKGLRWQNKAMLAF
jgi:hypothetical protein